MEEFLQTILEFFSGIFYFYMFFVMVYILPVIGKYVSRRWGEERAYMPENLKRKFEGKSR